MQYDWTVKSKPNTEEFTAFESALRRVLRVSHAEMQQKLKAEKAAKKRKPKKTSASFRASRDSG
jgi:hypothetical protein